MLGHDSVDSVVRGVIRSDDQAMLIASRPVIHSDRTGPIQGSLIMGRLVSEELVADLRDQTHVELDMWVTTEQSASAAEIGTIRLEPESDDVLLGMTEYTDIYDQPALALRARMSREVVARG